MNQSQYLNPGSTHAVPCFCFSYPSVHSSLFLLAVDGFLLALSADSPHIPPIVPEFNTAQSCYHTVTDTVMAPERDTSFNSPKKWIDWSSWASEKVELYKYG